MMDIVPLITLSWVSKSTNTANTTKWVMKLGRVGSYGVTVTVNGGGCTELVKTMSPSVELLSSGTPQTGMAVVVTLAHQNGSVKVLSTCGGLGDGAEVVCRFTVEALDLGILEVVGSPDGRTRVILLDQIGVAVPIGARL